LYAVVNRHVGRPLGGQYGPGEGEIWLDGVICLGTETDITECQHNGWAGHSCEHQDDVSVSCYSINGTSSSRGFSPGLDNCLEKT